MSRCVAAACAIAIALGECGAASAQISDEMKARATNTVGKVFQTARKLRACPTTNMFDSACNFIEGKFKFRGINHAANSANKRGIVYQIDYQGKVLYISEDSGRYAVDVEAAAKQEADQAKRKRIEDCVPLEIGMTEDDVVRNCWGRPERVNTTVTARGRREQWVYGRQRYLYFENGRLTAMQY